MPGGLVEGAGWLAEGAGGLVEGAGGLVEGAGGLAEGAAREQRVQGPGGGMRVEGPEDERQDEQV